MQPLSHQTLSHTGSLLKCTVALTNARKHPLSLSGVSHSPRRLRPRRGPTPGTQPGGRGAGRAVTAGAGRGGAAAPGSPAGGRWGKTTVSSQRSGSGARLLREWRHLALRCLAPTAAVPGGEMCSARELLGGGGGSDGGTCNEDGDVPAEQAAAGTEGQRAASPGRRGRRPQEEREQVSRAGRPAGFRAPVAEGVARGLRIRPEERLDGRALVGGGALGPAGCARPLPCRRLCGSPFPVVTDPEAVPLLFQLDASPSPCAAFQGAAVPSRPPSWQF